MTQTHTEEQTPGDGPTGTFEAAMAATQRDLDAVLKSANLAIREAKRALAAARAGQVRDLRKSLTAAASAASGLAEEARAAAAGFDFDERTYLASGAYTKELLAEAEARGLSILEDDDRLLCYPSLLRVLPNDAVIEIDKVRERRLRPSVLVDSLAKAQERGVRFNAVPFLDSLRAAYELQVAREGKRRDAVVRLVDVWTVLTIMPGARSQYSKQEFARDLYLLDQSGVTETPRSPRSVRFSASTGTKGAGKLVTVGRGGQEQVYWGVSFTSDEPEPSS